jgi:hypothetical protein
MMFLFRSGTVREKLWLVFKATRMHARNLGFFALVYKSTCLLLRTLRNGKEGHYDTFLAGLLGGYWVFGRTIRSSVSQQIVIYIFARVALATAKLLVHPKGELASAVPGGGGGFGLISDPKVKHWLAKNGWVAFASLSWACVMYLFRWHPEDLQPSLRSSMTYMWVASSWLCFLLMRRICANEVLQLCAIGSLGQPEELYMAQQMSWDLRGSDCVFLF